MRTLKSLFATAVLTIAVVFCLAGSAMGGEITSATATVSQNPGPLASATVDWDVQQIADINAVFVNVFAVAAWDEECSSAGYPYGELEPPGAVDFVEIDGKYENEFGESTSLTLASGTELCVGIVAFEQVSFVVAAEPIYFDAPDLSVDGAVSVTSTGVSIPLKVNPNNLETTVTVTFLKKIESTSCDFPGSVSPVSYGDASVETISDDLRSDHSVVIEVTGLKKETDYCFFPRATNAYRPSGSASFFQSTDGEVPVIDTESYSPGTASVNFSLNFTPNDSDDDASLIFQYFEKQGDDCTLVMGDESYFPYEDLSHSQGYESEHVADNLALPGLDADATYCIRAFSINTWGGTTPTSFYEFELREKEPTTASLVRVIKPTSGTADALLNFNVDDHGAAWDTGNDSLYEADVFSVPASQCNALNFPASPTKIHDGAVVTFGGQFEANEELDDLTYGASYCARIGADSAWGDDYDTVTFFAFKGAKAITLLDIDSSKTHDSITINASIDPGNSMTEYGTSYFDKQPNESCEDYNGKVHSGTGDITDDGISGSTEVSSELTSLDASTTYCVQFGAGNAFGFQLSDWLEITTNPTPEFTPPSKVVGLAATNVTTTSATLFWSAATDNVGVAGYRIQKNGQTISTVSGTSGSVDLACGTTTQFVVRAFDAQDNVGDASDPVSVTAAACPGPPSGGTTTPPPSTKQCFASIKPKSVSGKNGKKKLSIKLTFAVAADGQSIALSSKVKGTTLTFKVDGKKVTPKKGAVTIPALATSVTVFYKSGKKIKSIKIKPQRVSC